MNLPEETNDSIQKQERRIDFNIKDRTEQSEIINKTSESCAETGIFNISNRKSKKQTDHF